jgi:hypothetical protein
MIAAKVASSGALDKIAAEWRMPKELASDLVRTPVFAAHQVANLSGQAIPLRCCPLH